MTGTSVTITGTNFEPVAANNKSRFNVTYSTITSSTSTTIATTVPSTRTSGRITVATPAGTAVSSGDFFVPPPPYTAADVVDTGRMVYGESRTMTLGTANKIALMVFDGVVGQRALVSNNSPFDRFIKGDQHAITENQKAGWLLFKGKAKCIECHMFSVSAPLFTDFKFYNTGIALRDEDFETLTALTGKIKNLHTSSLAHEPRFSELGRFLVTNDKKDIGAFKTPTLRDVELTGPYMHNGSLRTLLDVVRFYNQGGQKNPNLHTKMRSLELNEQEINQLVEFLRALTSDDVLRQVQSSKPQTRAAVIVAPQ